MENENNRINEEIQETAEAAEKAPAKTVVGEILEWVYSLGIAFLIVFILKGFIFDIVKVDGESMYPTLHHNDRLIVTKLGYEPENGDIVILDRNYDNRQEFYSRLAADKGKEELSWIEKLFASFRLEDSEKKIFYVKRVIATEGQTVDIRDGKVYVDGEELHEEYISSATPVGDYMIEYPLTVEEGKIFVMGDNRTNSLDSRFSSLGQVDEEAVLGKAQFRFYPFNSIGLTR